MALVAEFKDSQTGARKIIAMGRLDRVYDTGEAEFSLLVRDDFQRCGLGTELLRRLIAIGRDEHPRCVISAVILPKNCGMLRICEKLGFRTEQMKLDDLVHAELLPTDPVEPTGHRFLAHVPGRASEQIRTKAS
jgi:acetyltransferase